MGLRDFEQPAELPDLPVAEITDVWLFSETYGEDRNVVWRGGEGRAWQRLVLARLPVAEVLVFVASVIAAQPVSAQTTIRL